MTVATANTSTYAEQGYITISWTALPPAGNYVLRRRFGTGPWVVLYTGSATSYVDWLIPSDTAPTYEVQRTSGTNDPPFTIPMVSTDFYWLLHPTTSSLNVRLDGVTDESFSDEQEEEVLNIIGRGRHVDYGTKYGRTGTLTARIRESETQSARGRRIAVDTLKGTQSWVWLRNPFGDLWKVSLGQIQVARISGVGHREDVDLTIPYMEVA